MMCLLQWCHFFTMLVSEARTANSLLKRERAGNSPAYNNLVANVELELHIVQYLCVYFNCFFQSYYDLVTRLEPVIMVSSTMMHSL